MAHGHNGVILVHAPNYVDLAPVFGPGTAQSLVLNLAGKLVPVTGKISNFARRENVQVFSKE